MKVRLFRPYLDENDLSSIKEVFDANWLGLGTKVEEFETQWSAKFGVKYSIGLNSATAALHLALAAYRFPKGKKVLIPALTFSATAMAVLYNDLEPVFVDVEPSNLTMDVSDFEKKIDKDCVAVIPVHYGGSACEMESIIDIAKRYNLKVIEDCAHSQGGVYKGKFLGTWGDIGCFSFEEKKGMTTGDGGMLSFNDTEMYNYLKPMRWVGIDKDTWKRVEGLSKLEDFGFHWFYEIRNIGFKYNMNNMAAALGITQLAKLDAINETKNDAIRQYIQNLAGVGDFSFLMDYNNSWTGAYWLFGLRVKNRSELINFLSEKGISTGVHFTPLNQQPFFKKFVGETPVTDSMYPELLTLPLYPMMESEQVSYVCEMIKKFYQK